VSNNNQWPDKDPGDTLDYDVDLSQADLPAGETIATVDWSIDPPGGTSPLTEEAKSHDDSAMTATIWLSGGDVGTDYTLTMIVTLTTNSAPVAPVIERDIGLNCRNLI
jgi:hypothetical protein